MRSVVTKLTKKQAYASMYIFLERIYDCTKSDELGGLLGSMSLLPDGTPADPAFQEDWDEAVNFVLKDQGVDIDLKLE